MPIVVTEVYYRKKFPARSAIVHFGVGKGYTGIADHAFLLVLKLVQ